MIEEKLVTWLSNWISGDPAVEMFLEREMRKAVCACQLAEYLSDMLDGSEAALAQLKEIGADMERTGRFVKKIQGAGSERLAWEKGMTEANMELLNNWLLGKA